jgi:hypothetical protein
MDLYLPITAEELVFNMIGPAAYLSNDRGPISKIWVVINILKFLFPGRPRGSITMSSITTLHRY